MKSIEKILAKFEGTEITNLGELATAIGRPRVTAYRWARDAEDGGTGGEVPRMRNNVAAIKILAAKHDIELPLEVWFND